ncbi:Lrp/AsnC family transcriptional regulator [Novosphingobium profundi]|uniref:Lrp/AsnC family transcriptional regulator n=1 Tax=Novosphingobium profundi TaxID=1774954 RepID=UPI001CFC7B98|nr:Lrp/AsnC family transcriptional regulator [Novosphingobium profundi]
MAKDRLDSFDRRILEILQLNGELGPSELSTRIHLSPSQCSRRLQRLREEGYIQRTAAILDPEKLNLGISAYVSVRLRSQSTEIVSAFRERVEALPEVVSCDYTTGEIDFMLKVHTRDLASYSEFVNAKLFDGDLIDNMRTFVIMQQLKRTTSLTLDYC